MMFNLTTKKTVILLSLVGVLIFGFAAAAQAGGGGGGGTGGGGTSPITYLGTYLTTTINNTSSTTGPSIVNSTEVPNTAIFKLEFDKNVVSDTQINGKTVFENNQDSIVLETSAGITVPAKVFRVGSGTNTDPERDNIFLQPSANLTAGQQYKIVILPTLEANNGLTLGKQQVTKFTAVAATTAPAWTTDSVVSSTNLADNAVTLNWPAASDQIGVAQYNIYRDGTLLISVDGNTTSYTLTGLTPKTAYTFQVEAENWALVSSTALSLKLTTPASPDTVAPAWPTGSSLTATQITAASLTLSWTPATDNVGVTAYKIYKNGTLLATVTGDITHYNIAGLTAGTKYTFKVEAGNGAGLWSQNGPQIAVTTTAVPVGAGDLPKTGTQIYDLIPLGVLLIGAGLFILQRRRNSPRSL